MILRTKVTNEAIVIYPIQFPYDSEETWIRDFCAQTNLVISELEAGADYCSCAFSFNQQLFLLHVNATSHSIWLEYCGNQLVPNALETLLGSLSKKINAAFSTT